MMKNWISKAIQKSGNLRKKLGAKKGENIPTKDLVIKKGDSTATKKQKNLAKTLKKIKKK